MVVGGVIAVAAVVALATAASPRAGVDWLATFDAAPGVSIGVWTLVESTSVWPSAISGRKRAAYEAGYLEDYRYIFENKGDYVRVMVYVEDDARWILSDRLTVAFAYADTTVLSTEVVLLEAGRRGVLSSRKGGVVDPAGRDLQRSGDGGFPGYVRFPPGSLPRPRGGGNKWGLVQPNRASAQEGGTADDEADPDPARRVLPGLRADVDDDIARSLDGG